MAMLPRARLVLGLSSMMLSAVTQLGCGGTCARDTPAPSAMPDVRALAGHANQFGFALFQQLRTRPGNLVLSPLSVHTALTMTYAGARGRTATEMASVLRLDPADTQLHASYGGALRAWNTTEAVTLRVVNRLFAAGNVSLQDDFVTLTRGDYNAPIETLNFAGAPDAARVTINEWVAERTEDRIEELLPSGAITSATQLVLTNAIYFKGSWQTPFDARLTSPQPFLVNGTTESSVDMMRMHARFRWAQLPDGVRVLETPYEGGDLSMVWLLPSERGTPHALDTLEAALNEDTLRRWRDASMEVEVQVQIPRFRLAPPVLMLSDTLQALGMHEAFGAAADFSGMTRSPSGLAISEVFHKAFIEVNEEGAEAAAATAVVMTEGAAMPPSDPPRFIADHPFLFLLLDRRSGAVLFLGRVSDPR